MKPLGPQRFERAVKGLALYRAISCREINDKREAYFATHMEELITKALVDVWRLPQFARRHSLAAQAGWRKESKGTFAPVLTMTRENVVANSAATT